MCILWSGKAHCMYYIVPVDWWHTRHILLVTNTIREQFVPDLPGKKGHVLTFVVANSIHYFWCCHFWFWATNNLRSNGPCLMKSEIEPVLFITCLLSWHLEYFQVYKCFRPRVCRVFPMQTWLDSPVCIWLSSQRQTVLLLLALNHR